MATPDPSLLQSSGDAAQSPDTSPDQNHAEGGHSKAGFWGLTVGSIGVVYGDIGTSPLYAFREALVAAMGRHGQSVTGLVPPRETVLGLISLVIWTLMLIVTIKYVLLLLRADNNGEGGTLSLMSLAQRGLNRGRGALMVVAMIGASLFYADSVITPAISVLSAVEGLKLVAPSFSPYIVPTTIIILFVLFAVQSHGTARVATFFGPITLVWFLVMGVAGAMHIADDLGILHSFNPYWGVKFLINHSGVAFLTLGAIFLCVTGAEALYADLGHFGRKPIQFAWLAVVFPCLVLNYLGQGAMVLAHPETLENPFYLLVPEWALVPLILLATMATVIASQAVITGAFSLTRQAVQLGLLPRIDIRHTSEAHSGQIYVPKINRMMLIGVVLLVLMFKSSSNLANMYGIAVTGALLVDALMGFVVMWRVWKWGLPLALLVMVPFFVIEGIFLAANIIKVPDGGWAPLFLGAAIVMMMLTWRRGSRVLFQKTRKNEVPLFDLVKMLEKSPPHRVPGTAIFLTSDPESAPTALLHNLKHNKVLHEKNVILTIRTADTPRVNDDDRITVDCISPGFMRLGITFGFMETPNLPKGIAQARKYGLICDIMSTSFFLSRRSLKAAAQPAMPLWQDRIFLALAKSADNATDYFHIPSSRVVEVGTQVTI
jgi:KUP system potassium uptake protein